MPAKSRRGYTTYLKQLQNMEDKGLVSSEKRRRPHAWKPRVRQSTLRRVYTQELIDKFFNADVGELYAFLEYEYL